MRNVAIISYWVCISLTILKKLNKFMVLVNFITTPMSSVSITVWLLEHWNGAVQTETNRNFAKRSLSWKEEGDRDKAKSWFLRPNTCLMLIDKWDKEACYWEGEYNKSVSNRACKYMSVRLWRKVGTNQAEYWWLVSKVSMNNMSITNHLIMKYLRFERKQ